jgi:hypothetical protein
LREALPYERGDVTVSLRKATARATGIAFTDASPDIVDLITAERQNEYDRPFVIDLEASEPSPSHEPVIKELPQRSGATDLA